MSTPPSIAITDSGELLAPGIELLRAAGLRVDVIDEGLDPGSVVEAISSATVAIIGVRPVRGPDIARLRTTRLLIRAGIGVDIIDVEAATAAGILVANVPDYCVDEVADQTVLLLLAAWRRLLDQERLWHAGRWVDPSATPVIHRIRGSRLGIVGFGRIGRAVAARARGFGWSLTAFDPFLPEDELRAESVEPATLEAIFASSDAITLHLPLTPETRHLVDAGRLRNAKPGLVIVNTSRGELVDLDALEVAMDEGRVGSAALDVIEGEPRPDLTRSLLSRPGMLVTPHLAWYSAEARTELAVLAARNAQRFAEGLPPWNVVNPDARPRMP